MIRKILWLLLLGAGLPRASAKVENVSAIGSLHRTTIINDCTTDTSGCAAPCKCGFPPGVVFYQFGFPETASLPASITVPDCPECSAASAHGGLGASVAATKAAGSLTYAEASGVPTITFTSSGSGGASGGGRLSPTESIVGHSEVVVNCVISFDVTGPSQLVTITPTIRKYLHGNLVINFDQIQHDLQQPFTALLAAGHHQIAVSGDMDSGILNCCLQDFAFDVTVTVTFPQTLYAVLLGDTADPRRRRDLDLAAFKTGLSRFPGVKPGNISVVHSKSAAASALGAIGNKITPGDTLVFFYVGHGDWNRDDDTEPPVETTSYVRTIALPGVTQNRGDEYLAVNGKEIHLPNGAPNPAAQTITDDELADWFRAVPNSALVRKIAVLSACFSGGFWSGATGPRTNTGDLDLVPNTALFASTQESDTGEAEDTLTGDGRSLFVKSLEVALGEMANQHLSLSFNHLRDKLTSFYTTEHLDPSHTGDFVVDGSWFDSDLAVRLDQVNLSGFAAATADFDQDAPLTVEPLPLTITTQPQGRTVTADSNVVFTVSAVGAEPLSYQWRKDTVDISGATDATYMRTNVQPADSGLYTVEVSTETEAVASAEARLAVFNSFAASFNSTRWTNGRFEVNLTGVPGFNYAIQLSNNLTDWVSRETNAAPFTFTDSTGGTDPTRFYRAVRVP